MSPQQTIFTAVRNNDPAAITAAVSADSSVLDARDERGSTPLVLAGYLNHPESVKALVEAGADVNTVSGTGTALMGVCFKGYPDIARYLIEAGADVNISIERMGTALTFANMGKHTDVIELLKANGAK
ncbi:ankyrin repeat domain-containing protein [Neolewinella aurantiaca]|uniref:Ankyrin repeat domain-containing protein n=1 Tax=Neolewinella aurantiaca TaxID=2602767 RepID=A0A5C7G0M6_9BACT|nr:ankyrin repeat domain-containing protein [Neolewinella aurantiaca]TXF91275.1 ankyrin repeat domain-containing protein [Neolewinella aurantiaca]